MQEIQVHNKYNVIESREEKLQHIVRYSDTHPEGIEVSSVTSELRENCLTDVQLSFERRTE